MSVISEIETHWRSHTRALCGAGEWRVETVVWSVDRVVERLSVDSDLHVIERRTPTKKRVMCKASNAVPTTVQDHTRKNVP